MILIESEFKVSPNIPTIKYLGKAHEKLIIHLFNSISLTLDETDICSHTKI